MIYPVNYNEIKSTIQFYSEVSDLHHEAENYLRGFKWCTNIVDSNLYLNLGSVLCVFTFEIDNSYSFDDNLLWVIVGDLPPMYLDTHGAKTTKQALEDYISLATDWIQKVKAKKSIEDCYPFSAQPTIEMATLLEKKVSFIRENIIDNVDEIALGAGH